MNRQDFLSFRTNLKKVLHMLDPRLSITNIKQNIFVVSTINPKKKIAFHFQDGKARLDYHVVESDSELDPKWDPMKESNVGPFWTTNEKPPVLSVVSNLLRLGCYSD